MTSLLGRLPGSLAPASSPADEDDLSLFSDGEDAMFSADPGTSRSVLTRYSSSPNPYIAPRTASSRYQTASAGSLRASRQSSSASASGRASLLDLTPKFTVISSTVSNNLHVQVSRLTQQFCATEDAVSAFDGRLSRVERMPAMFEEMLDGVVEKLRIADNSGVLAELREALGCIKAAVMDLRDEVDGVKDMREAIRQLQGEVEELKQGRQRYGKERERAENGLEERWARDREVERARDERRAAKRAEEQCENDELRARVIAIGKQHSIMAQAFEALKADYEEKHCELVRKISARPAFDVQKSLQPLFGKLDRLHELLDATRQAGPTVVQDSRPHASPTLSTVDPMRFLDISLSDNGDEIPDMPLFNRADAAEVFTVVGGPVDPDPRDSIQFIDDGDYAHHTGRLTDSQAVHRYTQQPQPRSSSEDWVEEDPSLEQQVLYAETANMESGNITVGGAHMDEFEMPDAGPVVEDTRPADSSDSSNVRLQTPATVDLEDDEATGSRRPASQSVVNGEAISSARTARKRRIPASQSSVSEEEDYERKRLRLRKAPAAPPASLTAPGSSQTSKVTSVHVSASRRPRPLKKSVAPKRKSQGLRKDVGPRWRMNVRPLAVSDGTRRGTVEWPLKAEYTVKGRAQEIICDVCKGRAHWFCAGFEDDDPAPEGEWHCPDCAEKLALGTPRGTIETAPQTRCIRYNCLLKAKIKTVRKEGDQDEWYPERIIGRQAIGRVKDSDARIFLYLIKWADWGIEWSTWEPVKNFSTQLHMIDDFMAALIGQGIRSKPRVNLLTEAAKYFDAETTELKPEYAADTDDEEASPE